MQNDPSLNPKILGEISSDFIKVADQLKEASYQIRSKAFSKFPIFPIAKEDIPIGSILIDRMEVGNIYGYYASFKEEFTQRQLIEKEQDFESIYKNPDEFCCLFVVTPHFTNYLFVPFPID